jgi:predicted RNase H-like nuclease (RuvC/YqgF family)
LPARRFAIVGIDPGATVAIAGLDLEGGLFFAESFKNEGIAEAVRRIEERCTPSLLACDTRPAPEAALRLASYFSCRLFSPRENVREEEKKKIAEQGLRAALEESGGAGASGLGPENAHERDAYCAAVFAYRACANKLRQIDALDGLSLEEKGRVKHLLLRGYKVQDAFMLLREAEGTKGTRDGAGSGTFIPKPAAAPSKQISHIELRSRLESLARENANLKLANERLAEEKGALLHRVRLLENGARQTLLRDLEYRKLRAEVERLRIPMRRKEWAKKAKKGAQEAMGGRQAHPVKTGAGQEKRGENAHFPLELNNLGELKVDLESLVREYRKGRKY